MTDKRGLHQRPFLLLVAALVLTDPGPATSEPNFPDLHRLPNVRQPSLNPAWRQPGAPDRGYCPLGGLTCTWERTFGGPGQDRAYALTPMPDDGLVVAGHTRWAAGQDNGWVMRLDREGRALWERILGGPGTDQIYGVVATPEGGVVVAGHSSTDSSGKSDVWVVKLNEFGAVEWERAFGGVANDRARAIASGSNGGYLVGGFTRSKGAGDGDAWLLHLDANGELLWERVLGGRGDDGVFHIEPLNDGWVMAGFRQFSDHRNYDIWVVRLDVDGDLVWEQTFDRHNFDAASAIAATPDGGALVVGQTSRSITETDAWVLHLDGEGRLLWERVIGGPKVDSAWDVAVEESGMAVVMLATSSFGSGSTDAWLVGLNSEGATLWENTYGGRSWDRPSALEKSVSGGLLLAGYTTAGRRYEECWLLRLNRRGGLYE